MNVYAFYEPINEPWVNQHDQQILIDLWKKSWNHYGWNPVIITLDDAKKHSLYDNFYKKIEQFPTVCPKIYDMYCFLRWLSFANFGGWMSAVSIMNYGFTPVDYNDLENIIPGFKFLNGPCNPCDKQYNCPFRIDVNDRTGDKISPIWAELWHL